MTGKINGFKGPYRYLSNFWPARVTLDGVEYPSTEHAYQAAKTVDKVTRERIRQCEKPGAAKRMGGSANLRSDWEQVKLGVMEDLLRQKFAHKELGDLLLGTGHMELVEFNTWSDTWWGVDAQKGGLNHLGRLLMQVRGELRGSK